MFSMPFWSNFQIVTLTSDITDKTDYRVKFKFQIIQILVSTLFLHRKRYWWQTSQLHYLHSAHLSPAGILRPPLTKAW